ncbi:adhesin [Fusobacterium varium]|uniref:adhesion protein FadA n=1 Tax=Fusobacterium varium TaxID=856 RepID=UPI000E4BFD77|nr:adhesion protein FadA [Fusobacterium varium]RHG35289.1 adhesin [Fusobacterium varium]
MKKIIIGCFLAVSAVSYSATDVMSTLEQLELNLQQLEAEERAMYNQRKAEAEEAEKTLEAQRKMYAEISEKEKRILSVKDNKFYKGQYQELAKKYGEAKKELEVDMRKQEEIISIFEAIK